MAQAINTGNVIIIDPYGIMDGNLPEALRSKGFRSENAASAIDVSRKIHLLTKPLIYVEAGTSAERAHKLVKELLAEKDLTSYPLVIMGASLDQFLEEITKTFPSFEYLIPPAKASTIVSAIESAYAHFDQKGKLSPTISYPEEKRSGGGFQQFETASTSSPRDAVPGMVFDELKRLGLNQKSIGGNLYPRVTFQGVEGKPISPVSSRVKKLLADTLASARPMHLLRVNRVNYASQQIANALSLDVEKTLQLSLMYARSFIVGPEELLTKEYLGARRAAFRMELCSRIKDSAMDSGFELNDPELGKLISSIGKIIGEEQMIPDSEEGLILGAVVAADLLERSCTRRGHFNPRVAYDLMRKIRLGSLDWMPLTLLSVMVKFLSEALASSATKLLLPKKSKLDAATQQKVAQILAEPLASGESQVGISDLSPGMHLARPIHSFDGTQILEGDLTLDEDLVMRIWQLASIRPLIDPTVKKTDRTAARS